MGDADEFSIAFDLFKFLLVLDVLLLAALVVGMLFEDDVFTLTIVTFADLKGL